MIDHPSPTAIEALALGASDDDDVLAHCSSCDVCAAELAREARLELALGELHEFRRDGKQAKRSQVLLRIVPLVVLAAAALVLFVVRGASTSADVSADVQSEPRAAASGPNPPPGADDVIASLRPSFRQCYQSAAEPSQGKVVFRVEVAPEGTVRALAIESNTGLAQDVVTCLLDVLHKATFTGTGDVRTLTVPITFVRR